MIEIKDVTKSYGRQKVLQNVSFEIMEGELFGLLGPNGAGKSTLIDILTGIQSMDSGEIFINGKSIKTDKVEIRKHLGLVPQDIALLEELNAVDNLEYFGGLYGLAGAELAGSGLSKADSKKALDATVAAIKEALVKGDKVQLVGFGTFSVNERPAHGGVNPATKEKITIAAKKVAKFKAGAELTEAIQ